MCIWAAGICAAAAFILDQRRGLLSVAGSAGIVLVYFVSGYLIEQLAMALADRQGMAVIMSGYVMRVLVLGLFLHWAMHSEQISSLVLNAWVAAGTVSSVIGWLCGIVLGHSRSRIALYDRAYIAPEGWEK